MISCVSLRRIRGPVNRGGDLRHSYSAVELVNASHTSRESEHLAQAALNALSPRTAVLDNFGVTIMVNNAWRSFAVSNLDTDHYKSCCEGINYLHVCDQAHGRDSECAAQMAIGVRAVMRHERREYALKYACHDTHGYTGFLAG
jgi:hypothetical protein